MKYKPLVNEELIRNEAGYSRQIDFEVLKFIKKNKLTKKDLKHFLSKKEIEALKLYTKKDGKPNWKEVNRKMRNGIELSEEENIFFKTVSQALEQKVQFEIVTYRGIHVEKESDCELLTSKVGDIINFRAFTSSSLSLRKALDYAFGKEKNDDIKLLLKVDVPRNSLGLVLQDISESNSSEYEFLLSEKNNYRVKKITKNEFGLDYVFELEII